MSLKNAMKKIVRVVTPAPQIKAEITLLGEGEKLQNKCVLITGGGSGIGKATAQKVVREGGKVVIIGRRENTLKEVCQEMGERCSFLAQDMTAIKDYDEFFRRAEQVAGSAISALVCNAGIYLEPKNTYHFSEEDFDKTIAINLKAPMMEIMHYVEYCENRGIKGTVVVTASNRGLFGDHGPYGVSKKGIIHYIQGMARDCIQKGIRINACLLYTSIASTSSAGIMMMLFVWGYEMILCKRKLSSKFSIVIFACILAIIFLNSDLFLFAREKFLNVGSTTSDYTRLMKGWVTYWELPLKEKLIGVGQGFIQQFMISTGVRFSWLDNIALQSISRWSYQSTAGGIFVDCGFVIGCMYYVFIARLFKKKNKISKDVYKRQAET